MSHRELELLRSEIAMLEHFVSELTDAEPIERMQFEHRLEEAKTRLAEMEVQPQSMALPITFRGRPVEGTHSIDAAFATQALKAFVEATETVASSRVADELKGKGRLPGLGDRSLRIVDTAVGSFGFELELPPLPPSEEAQGEVPLEPKSDPFAQAIIATLDLIGEASSNDEDAISDLVAEVHPRAAVKVRAFARVLADNGALFAAEFQGKQVRLDRDAQVQRIVDSLKDDDISEDGEEHLGTLLGILPDSRQFEAQLATGRILHGKVDRSVDIAAFKAKWESVEARLKLRVVRVRANRRYFLVDAQEKDAFENGNGALQKES